MLARVNKTAVTITIPLFCILFYYLIIVFLLIDVQRYYIFIISEKYL